MLVRVGLMILGEGGLDRLVVVRGRELVLEVDLEWGWVRGGRRLEGGWGGMGWLVDEGERERWSWFCMGYILEGFRGIFDLSFLVGWC